MRLFRHIVDGGHHPRLRYLIGTRTAGPNSRLMIVSSSERENTNVAVAKPLSLFILLPSLGTSYLRGGVIRSPLSLTTITSAALCPPLLIFRQWCQHVGRKQWLRGLAGHLHCHLRNQWPFIPFVTGRLGNPLMLTLLAGIDGVGLPTPAYVQPLRELY